jgi:HAMP domain-containing protein/lysophospholipase L1-like esterase
MKLLRGPRGRWAAGLLLALILVAGLAATAAYWRRVKHAQDSLARHLQDIRLARPDTQIPCASLKATKPLVLLVLGQSNAANHGEIGALAGPLDMVTSNPRGTASCHRVFDPLPGGTAAGHSLWSRLPLALAQAGVSRPIVVGLLGVDATSVADWTDDGSPLLVRLQTLARQMTAAGFAPDLVLWQHGESNARLGTTAQDYAQRVRRLSALLKAAGVQAPVVLARSTVCRSAPSAAIRTAVQTLVASSAAASPQFLMGPDTDALSAPHQRRDGCHFSSAGLDAGAAQWAQVLAPLSGLSR